jgi:hypothetical protein
MSYPEFYWNSHLNEIVSIHIDENEIAVPKIQRLFDQRLTEAESCAGWVNV